MDQNPPEFTAEDVLDAYTVSPDPVEVLLPDGRKLLFSALPTTMARKALNAAIDAMLAAIPGVQDKGHKAHFISKLPFMEYAEMRTAAEIAIRSLKPKFSPETAFRLHQAPTVVSQIADKLDFADKELLTLWYVNQAEAAQKKTQTLGSADGSPPAEPNSPDATPTT